MTHFTDPALTQALAKIFPHLRDLSARDAIQSHDGNKWKIEHVLMLMGALDKLALVVKDQLNIDTFITENSGGGQIAQPAMFLFENPFENLRQMCRVAPNVTPQCLWRGRFGFGFEERSPEDQAIIINHMIKSGMKIFRIFDMSNDITNIQASFEIIKAHKETHPDNGLKIEGAISFNTEPREGELGFEKGRVWEVEDYTNYAVELAKLGAEEIVIKNYAGTRGEQMPDLIRAVRARLIEEGFDIPVNLHIHEEYADLLVECLSPEVGADKVDVAIGELSDEHSHSNMRTVIHKWMAANYPDQFSQEEIDAHPVMQEIGKIEALIAEIVHNPNNTLVPGKSFDDLRATPRRVTHEMVEEYGVAGGAISDFTGRAQSKHPDDPEAAWNLTLEMLKTVPETREKGGRFNTVTPGSKICSDQAVIIVTKAPDTPFTMEDYDPQFIKIITGRYGRNLGIEKGIGDVQLRDALLIFNSLKLMNAAVAQESAQKNCPYSYPAVTNELFLIIANTGFGNVKMEKGSVKLNDPDLEEILKQEGLVDRFKAAVEKSGLNNEFKQKILTELTPGTLPVPTLGMEWAREMVNPIIAAKKADHLVTDEEREEYMVLAIMLRQPPKHSFDNGCVVVENLLNKLLDDKLKSAPQFRPPGNDPV